MGPLSHWYGITIVCKVLVEESYQKTAKKEPAEQELSGFLYCIKLRWVAIKH